MQTTIAQSVIGLTVVHTYICLYKYILCWRQCLVMADMCEFLLYWLRYFSALGPTPFYQSTHFWLQSDINVHCEFQVWEFRVDIAFLTVTFLQYASAAVACYVFRSLSRHRDCVIMARMLTKMMAATTDGAEMSNHHRVVSQQLQLIPLRAWLCEKHSSSVRSWTFDDIAIASLILTMK